MAAKLEWLCYYTSVGWLNISIDRSNSGWWLENVRWWKGLWRLVKRWVCWLNVDLWILCVRLTKFSSWERTHFLWHRDHCLWTGNRFDMVLRSRPKIVTRKFFWTDCLNTDWPPVVCEDSRRFPLVMSSVGVVGFEELNSTIKVLWTRIDRSLRWMVCRLRSWR